MTITLKGRIVPFSSWMIEKMNSKICKKSFKPKCRLFRKRLQTQTALRRWRWRRKTNIERRSRPTANIRAEGIGHNTPEEVRNLITNVKKRKAVGHDQIVNRALKRFTKKTLTNVNTILRLRYFPSKCKIFKCYHAPYNWKIRDSPQNYRLSYQK